MSLLVMVANAAPEVSVVRHSASQQPPSSARASEPVTIVNAPTVRPIHAPRIAISNSDLFGGFDAFDAEMIQSR